VGWWRWEERREWDGEIRGVFFVHEPVEEESATQW
jgi:hypothetical protein